MLQAFPQDIIALIASYGHVTAWRRVLRFDERFAAACRVQRAWREYRATARFVLGATVRIAPREDRARHAMVAQFVGRRRVGATELWTARLFCARFRHYIHLKRHHDPTFRVLCRVVRTQACARRGRREDALLRDRPGQPDARSSVES